MLTDPIGDMLTRIKSALLNGADMVEFGYSKQKKAILMILKKEGCIKDFKVDKDAKGFFTISIELLYLDNTPMISSLKRISKPSLRLYAKAKNIPRLKSGLGLIIISTPKGIMSGEDARKKGLGGELICEVL